MQIPIELKRAMDKAIQCTYIRFQAPVAPLEDKEPVYELKLSSKDPRYKVDEICHDSHTVYWRIDDTVSQTPWVNVQLARPIHEPS